jgi:hypothetical protein
MADELSLEKIFGFLLDWTIAIVHPIDTCRRLLSMSDERERFQAILKLWLASVVISIVAYLPVSHKYGIDLNTVGFDACFLLGFTAILVASGFAIQIGLRLRHVSSRLSDVLAMYTAYFVCYEPLCIVASYPQSYHFFDALNTSKHEGIYFLQALKLYVGEPHPFATAVDAANIFSTVCSWVLLPVLCTSTALLVRTVAETCDTTKLNSFSAITFTSIAILLPLTVVQSFIITYVVFAFMKG